MPKGSIDVELKDKVEGLYKYVGEAIEQTKFKVALESIFEYVLQINTLMKGSLGNKGG